MTIHFHPSNCGLRDMVIGYGSRDPKTVILEVCAACISPKYVSGKRVDKFAPIAAHILFSQACPKGAKPGSTFGAAYGEHLMNFIHEEKLGTVIKSSAILNPDHGPNYITAFIWTPDAKALEKWWEANKPEDKPKAPTIGVANYTPVKMYCPGLPHDGPKEGEVKK